MNYYIEPFKKITDINSTASNKQFWLFVLINFIISGFIGIIRGATGFENIGLIYNIIILIPFTALGFRRLNEVGVSKWLFLIPFVNIILAGLPAKENA